MVDTDGNPSFEDLEELEVEFEEVETEIVRQQYLLTRHLYAKRQALINKIPNFWPLVLEQAPPDLDQHIQPSDSEIIASSLRNVDVERFEISPAPASNASEKGSPRSFSIKFEFSPNDWFENDILEKFFWFRRAKDGYSGLVSDPVKIDWKKGKDITEGLTDAVFDLWEAEKKAAGKANGINGEASVANKPLPEHQALVKKIESTTQGSLSFFTWFGYRGRSISAEESAAACDLEKNRESKAANGEGQTSLEACPSACCIDSAQEKQAWDEARELEDEREVFPSGDDLAIAISDDIWPGAIKYFTQSCEQDVISEGDFEDSDALSSDEDEGSNINIRDLVRDKHGDESDKDRPKKKRKA